MNEQGKWLCKKCSGNNDKQVIYAGLGVMCEFCGMYAYSFYRTYKPYQLSDKL